MTHVIVVIIVYRPLGMVLTRKWKVLLSVLSVSILIALIISYGVQKQEREQDNNQEQEQQIKESWQDQNQEQKLQNQESWQDKKQEHKEESHCAISDSTDWRRFVQRRSEEHYTPKVSCHGEGKCPNIVYLLLDDLGYGDVGYNGGKAKTPHIDEMAHGEHSILFNRFYSGGPTCSPTRGTLLTGRNHNRYCIWHADLGNPLHDLTCPSLGPLPMSEVTIAELLQSAGYHTSIYGKWHVGDLKPVTGGNAKWPVSHPGMHGFADWMVTERHIANLLPNCMCSQRCKCAINGHDYRLDYCRNYWTMNSETGKLVKYPFLIEDDSEFLVNQLERLLVDRDPSVPFFTIISFHAVHDPFLAKSNWLKYYRSQGSDWVPAHYLGSISGVDEQIGRVRHLLKKHGVYNNTMLWFSSDNGPEKELPGSTGGLRGRKGKLWEGGIRVPGIIEWPGVIESNRVLSTPVVTSDLLPTVADILGFEVPKNITLDGISILPLLQSKTNERESNIKFAFHIHKGKLDSSFTGAVVGNRFKLWATFNEGKMQQFDLYDLTLEASEKTNVSMSHPEITLSMRDELNEFLKSVTKSASQTGCMNTHDRRTTDKC